MHRGQVARPEIGAVRHDADAERIGQRDDLPDLADAADLRHARLRDVDGAMLEHRAEIGEPRGVFAGGDGDALLAQCGEQLVVLRPPERLLKPGNVVAAHGAAFCRPPRASVQGQLVSTISRGAAPIASRATPTSAGTISCSFTSW